MSCVFHPVKTKFGHGRRAPRRILALLREPALSTSVAPVKLIAHPVERLEGRMRAPGDKSVSHRALMFGALALGETVVSGLLQGEDVLRTAAALRALGAQISRDGDVWRVRGFGVGGGREPDDVLDLGNSGTSARLLSGILASHPFTSFMTGDGSLRRRPMQRVIEPLSRMGARFQSREGGRMPLHFGAEVRVEPVEGGPGKRITVVGWPELKARDIIVPGDPSSAAFAVVAAAVKPGSDVLVENVGVNPLRAGLYITLKEMGADLTFEN